MAAGDSWTRVTDGVPSFDEDGNPTGSRATRIAQTHSGRLIVVGDISAYSDDGGVTWTSPSPFIRSEGDVLVVSPTGRIIAGRSDEFQGTTTPQVEYSDDDGVTTTLVTVPVASPTFYTSPEEILCLDSGKLLLFLRSGDLWASFDDAETWGFATSGLPEPRRACLQTTTGRVLVGGEGGIFVSDDEGATWSPRSFVPSVIPRAAIQSLNGRIFIGADEGIVLYSDDDGDTWAGIDLTGLLGVAFISHSAAVTGENRIVIQLAGSFASGYVYTDDDGATWAFEPIDAELLDAHAGTDMFFTKEGRLFSLNASGPWYYSNAGTPLSAGGPSLPPAFWTDHVGTHEIRRV